MRRAAPDLERLKRFGTWKSSASDVYLGEAHGPQKGLAEAMSAQNYQLIIGRANKLKSTASSPEGQRKVHCAPAPPEECPSATLADPIQRGPL